MADGRESPFSYVDLSRWNPWWDDPETLPEQGTPRTDLYWRVKNAIEHDLLIVPGPPVTGTTTTLRQIIRALALGADHENERIRALFEEKDEASQTQVDESGCDPRQLCYVPCTDPLAHLVDDFVNQSRLAYHSLSAQTGSLKFYLFFDGIYHLEDWREQLRETHAKLTREFPENWTLVATVPAAELAHETDFGDAGDIKTDLPHHTQKYRDTLFQFAPELRNDLRPSPDTDRVATARRTLRDAAVGDATADELEAALQRVVDPVEEHLDDGKLANVTDTYLTGGGFTPALSDASGRADGSVSPATLAAHVEQGIERTLYRDIPRMAKFEEQIPRIDHPEDLHALIAFLARRPFAETTYIDLGEFLGCDTRTIRQKYVPLLEGLHLGERATRYDLERDRTLRFYLRSPGYVTAFRGDGVTDEDRSERLRLTLSDHLRRLLARLGGSGGLQYWRDEESLVDYVVDVDDYPIPFVSAFADEGGTVAPLEAFADAVECPHLEVVITERDADVTVESIAEKPHRLVLPHWAMLAVC